MRERERQLRASALSVASKKNGEKIQKNSLTIEGKQHVRGARQVLFVASKVLHHTDGSGIQHRSQES
jgi:hypothetical protein